MDYGLRYGDACLPWVPPAVEETPVDIVMANEFKCSEACHVVQKSDALVMGVCAGSGKTTLCKSVIAQLKMLGKDLWIVPNNQRKKELLATGLMVDTYASLLGMRCTDDGEELADFTGEYLYNRDKDKPLSSYKVVVFDEMFSIDSETRGSLTRLIRSVRAWANPPRLLATGDTRQLVIEPDLNPAVDVKRVLMAWGRELFPTAIMLREPKRFPLRADKELVLGLPDALAKDRRAVLSQFKTIRIEDVPVGTKCISFLQTTRTRINNYLHYKTHTHPLEVGVKLVYRERSRKQGKHKLYVGFTYNVLEVTADTFKIEEDGRPDVTFDLLRAKAMPWFTYTHAGTGHSSQGSTYEGMVVIADTTCRLVTDEWLYVALTRGRKLRADVRILKGVIPTTVDVERIAANIASNLKADEEKGRPVMEAITVDWVLERDKMQGGRCAMCGHAYELPMVGCERTTETASVDRNDSARGHETANCRIVCRGCNFAKRDRLV